MSLLKLDDVSVEAGKSKLVSNISFEANAGEILVVAGPNGAGKSSLLKAISGEIKASSGSVTFAGKPLSNWSLQELACMRAMQSQLSLLNFPYRVEEVVALGRTPHSTGKRIDKEIVDQLLELMDLTYLKDRAYTQLSGGEKQRTQLARVIAQIWRAEDSDKRLLILDEPTTALDLGHQQQLIHFLKLIAKKGICILLVVHDLNTAAKIADNVLLMCCGEAMAFGSPETVFRQNLLEKVFGAKVRVIKDPETNEVLIIS